MSRIAGSNILHDHRRVDADGHGRNPHPPVDVRDLELPGLRLREVYHFTQSLDRCGNEIVLQFIDHHVRANDRCRRTSESLVERLRRRFEISDRGSEWTVELFDICEFKQRGDLRGQSQPSQQLVFDPRLDGRDAGRLISHALIHPGSDPRFHAPTDDAREKGRGDNPQVDLVEIGDHRRDELIRLQIRRVDRRNLEQDGRLRHEDDQADERPDDALKADHIDGTCDRYVALMGLTTQRREFRLDEGVDRSLVGRVLDLLADRFDQIRHGSLMWSDRVVFELGSVCTIHGRGHIHSRCRITDGFRNSPDKVEDLADHVEREAPCHNVESCGNVSSGVVRVRTDRH